MLLKDKPEHIRKIIFWAVIILMALAMLIWWWQNTKRRLSGLRGKDFIIQQVQPPKIELPKIEIPDITIPEEIITPGASTQDYIEPNQ